MSSYFYVSWLSWLFYDCFNLLLPVFTVEKVTEGLTQVAKQASPGSLAPVPIVRRAMGITVLPVTSEPANSSIEV